jgi:hypothetical protein
LQKTKEGRLAGAAFFHLLQDGLSEAAGAAHRAMIAGLAAGFDAARFLFLKVVNQL